MAEEQTTKKIDFGETFHRFIDNVDAIGAALSLQMSVLAGLRRKTQLSIKDFAREHGELEENEEEEFIFSATVKGIGAPAMRKLTRRCRRLETTLDQLPHQSIVSLVSNINFLVSDLVVYLYSKKPDLILSSGKQFSIADLKKYETINEIYESLVEDQCERVLFESHAKQIQWLSDKLGKTFDKNSDLYKAWIEVSERRNLYVVAPEKRAIPCISTNLRCFWRV